LTHKADEGSPTLEPDGMRPAPPVRELALPLGLNSGERLGSAVSETSEVSTGRQFR